MWLGDGITAKKCTAHLYEKANIVMQYFSYLKQNPYFFQNCKQLCLACGYLKFV